MKSLRARPLTADAYAPFGRVIAGGDHATSANQGSARKFERLVDLENLRPSATANVSVFRSMPRKLPFEIALLEKHPASTQIFVPMNARRYLVVVAKTAPNGHEPDLGTLEAFAASAIQGISYAPGTWHHPLIALEIETDFTCVVFEDGSATDCVEHAIAPDLRLLLSDG